MFLEALIAYSPLIALAILPTFITPFASKKRKPQA